MSVDGNDDGDTTDASDPRYYYGYDSMGNVIGLTDHAGHLVEGYEYLPYGEVKIRVPGLGNADVKWDTTDGFVSGGVSGSPESPSGNLWFFTGRQLDPEIGLYYYRAREYNPYLGQFMNADPIGAWGDAGNLGNPYAYVGNNPSTNRDPSGLMTLEQCTGPFGCISNPDTGAQAWRPAPASECMKNSAGFSSPGWPGPLDILGSTTRTSLAT